MEDLKTMSSCQNDNVHKPQERFHEEREDRLPGFRFHPTDEELVSFYLKRKVENRPITLQILNEIDVYKHDPWELAEVSSSAGDKEWYFYCKREKKYKNSVRPNRVTGSGFWKATGIDKPIYANGEGERCVGLKKSLVYYRGSAGKGSKTDWMMHEFRLPTHQTSPPNPKDTTLQEAEVWTICRIFRRCRKYTPNWRDLSAKRSTTFPNTKTCSDNESITNPERYISFSNTTTHQQQQQQQQYHNTKAEMVEIVGPKSTAHTSPSDSSPMNPSSSWVDDQLGGHFIAAYHGNWDDLSSLVEFAIRPPLT